MATLPPGVWIGTLADLLDEVDDGPADEPKGLAAMLKVGAIAELVRDCASIKDDGGELFCANAHWYGRGTSQGLKGRLKRLVGWGTTLGFASERDYSDLYKHAYGQLPDCRNCGCFIL